MAQINDFQFYLKFTKPLVLSLPKVKDRALAATWIKKLIDIDADEDVKAKYLQLLLFVLQRKRLGGIFLTDPTPLDKLEPFKETNLIDVARKLIEQETVERIKEAGDFPPIITDYSADLLEYVAVQKIPNFGVHAYYAMSKEPLLKWEKFDKAVFPKITDSMVNITEYEKSPPLSPEIRKRKKEKLFGAHPPTSLLGRIPKEEDRVPPSWGSNLLQVKDTVKEIEGTEEEIEEGLIPKITIDGIDDELLEFQDIITEFSRIEEDQLEQSRLEMPDEMPAKPSYMLEEPSPLKDKDISLIFGAAEEASEHAQTSILDLSSPKEKSRFETPSPFKKVADPDISTPSPFKRTPDIPTPSPVKRTPSPPPRTPPPKPTSPKGPKSSTAKSILIEADTTIKEKPQRPRSRSPPPKPKPPKPTSPKGPKSSAAKSILIEADETMKEKPPPESETEDADRTPPIFKPGGFGKTKEYSPGRFGITSEEEWHEASEFFTDKEAQSPYQSPREEQRQRLAAMFESSQSPEPAEDLSIIDDLDLLLSESYEQLKIAASRKMEYEQSSPAISGDQPLTVPKPSPDPKRPGLSPGTPKLADSTIELYQSPELSPKSKAKQQWEELQAETPKRAPPQAPKTPPMTTKYTPDWLEGELPAVGMELPWQPPTRTPPPPRPAFDSDPSLPPPLALPTHATVDDVVEVVESLYASLLPPGTAEEKAQSPPQICVSSPSKPQIPSMDVSFSPPVQYDPQIFVPPEDIQIHMPGSPPSRSPKRAPTTPVARPPLVSLSPFADSPDGYFETTPPGFEQEPLFDESLYYSPGELSRSPEFFDRVDIDQIDGLDAIAPPPGIVPGSPDEEEFKRTLQGRQMLPYTKKGIRRRGVAPELSPVGELEEEADVSATQRRPDSPRKPQLIRTTSTEYMDTVQTRRKYEKGSLQDLLQATTRRKSYKKNEYLRKRRPPDIMEAPFQEETEDRLQQAQHEFQQMDKQQFLIPEYAKKHGMQIMDVPITAQGLPEGMADPRFRAPSPEQRILTPPQMPVRPRSPDRSPSPRSPPLVVPCGAGLEDIYLPGSPPSPSSTPPDQRAMRAIAAQAEPVFLDDEAPQLGSPIPSSPQEFEDLEAAFSQYDHPPVAQLPPQRKPTPQEVYRQTWGKADQQYLDLVTESMPISPQYDPMYENYMREQRRLRGEQSPVTPFSEFKREVRAQPGVIERRDIRLRGQRQPLQRKSRPPALERIPEPVEYIPSPIASRRGPQTGVRGKMKARRIDFGGEKKSPCGPCSPLPTFDPRQPMPASTSPTEPVEDRMAQSLQNLFPKPTLHPVVPEYAYDQQITPPRQAPPQPGPYEYAEVYGIPIMDIQQPVQGLPPGMADPAFRPPSPEQRILTPPQMPVRPRSPDRSPSPRSPPLEVPCGAGLEDIYLPGSPPSPSSTPPDQRAMRAIAAQAEPVFLDDEAPQLGSPIPSSPQEFEDLEAAFSRYDHPPVAQLPPQRKPTPQEVYRQTWGKADQQYLDLVTESMPISPQYDPMYENYMREQRRLRGEQSPVTPFSEFKREVRAQPGVIERRDIRLRGQRQPLQRKSRPPALERIPEPVEYIPSPIASRRGPQTGVRGKMKSRRIDFGEEKKSPCGPCSPLPTFDPRQPMPASTSPTEPVEDRMAQSLQHLFPKPTLHPVVPEYAYDQQITPPRQAPPQPGPYEYAEVYGVPIMDIQPPVQGLPPGMADPAFRPPSPKQRIITPPIQMPVRPRSPDGTPSPRSPPLEVPCGAGLEDIYLPGSPPSPSSTPPDQRAMRAIAAQAEPVFLDDEAPQLGSPIPSSPQEFEDLEAAFSRYDHPPVAQLPPQRKPTPQEVYRQTWGKADQQYLDLVTESMPISPQYDPMYENYMREQRRLRGEQSPVTPFSEFKREVRAQPGVIERKDIQLRGQRQPLQRKSRPPTLERIPEPVEYAYDQQITPPRQAPPQPGPYEYAKVYGVPIMDIQPPVQGLPLGMADPAFRPPSPEQRILTPPLVCPAGAGLADMEYESPPRSPLSDEERSPGDAIYDISGQPQDSYLDDIEESYYDIEEIPSPPPSPVTPGSSPQAYHQQVTSPYDPQDVQRRVREHQYSKHYRDAKKQYMTKRKQPRVTYIGGRSKLGPVHEMPSLEARQAAAMRQSPPSAQPQAQQRARTPPRKMPAAQPLPGFLDPGFLTSPPQTQQRARSPPRKMPAAQPLPEFMGSRFPTAPPSPNIPSKRYKHTEKYDRKTGVRSKHIVEENYNEPVILEATSPPGEPSRRPETTTETPKRPCPGSTPLEKRPSRVVKRKIIEETIEEVPERMDIDLPFGGSSSPGIKELARSPDGKKDFSWMDR